jgi:hypothetical protein
MADELLDPQEPPGARRSWTHDRFPYQEYQVVHTVDGSGVLVLVTIRGRLACRHETAIRVDKKVEARRSRANRLEVRPGTTSTTRGFVRVRGGRGET